MIRGADPSNPAESRPSLSLRIPRGSAPLHAFSCGLGRMTKLRPDLPVCPPTPICPPVTPALTAADVPTTPGGHNNPFAPATAAEAVYGGSNTGLQDVVSARSRAMSAPAAMQPQAQEDDSMEESSSSGGSRSSMSSVEETEGDTSSAESGGSSRSLDASEASGGMGGILSGRARSDSRAKKKCLRVSFCAEVSVIACSAPASTPTWGAEAAASAAAAAAADGGMDSVSTPRPSGPREGEGEGEAAGAPAEGGAGGFGMGGMSMSMGMLGFGGGGGGGGGVAFFASERRSVSCDSGLSLLPPEYVRPEGASEDFGMRPWAARPPPPPMPVPSSGAGVGAGGVITGVLVDPDEDGGEGEGGEPCSPPSPLKRKRMLVLAAAGAGLEDSCDADIEDSTESHGFAFEMGSSYEAQFQGGAGEHDE